MSAADTSSATLNLRFETLDGRYFQFSSCRETVKAKAIKPLLEDQFGISSQEQELVFVDITSQLLLYDEAILNSGFQTILVRPKAREVKVSVILYPQLTRTEIVFNSQETIAGLKGKVQDLLGGVPTQNKTVYFHTKECSDHETLRYYQVRDNDELLVWDGTPHHLMTIEAKTLSGKNIPIEIHPWASVGILKSKIQEIEGIPPDQQRLIFAGRQMEDHVSLLRYGITSGASVHLVLRLRGMISSFSFNDRNDPLVRYLMLPESDRRVTPFPLESIQPKVLHEESVGSFRYTAEDCGILSENHRAVIGKFLDFMWSKKMDNNAAAGVDMKVVLPNDILVQVLLPFADRSHKHHTERLSPEQVLTQLLQAYNQGGLVPKIALRMTKGPTDACINFHRDGQAYANYTMQLALNDPEEYQGGKLCYFVQNRLHVLTRPAGSLVGHHRSVLHAVTALTQGVRKSLFLVDPENGLGEADIIVATPQDVTAFWNDSGFSSLCPYCFVQFADQDCNGCHKKSMCTGCSTTFVECPLCRIVQMVEADNLNRDSRRKRKFEEAS